MEHIHKWSLDLVERGKCLNGDCPDRLDEERAEFLVNSFSQLEAERDEARTKLSELQSLYAGVVMELFGIDKEVFGPLTAREGVAELKRQNDEARAALVRYKGDRVQLLGRIEELAARVKELEYNDNPYILHGEELDSAVSARIAGRP